mmetsp:Transcript_24639/g.85712  ORF Transcript_24639/g.85712 Transcript_24639/m.85712 type:complete len:291 (+) Transcript_24639:669-1541(+)
MRPSPADSGTYCRIRGMAPEKHTIARGMAAMKAYALRAPDALTFAWPMKTQVGNGEPITADRMVTNASMKSACVLLYTSPTDLAASRLCDCVTVLITASGTIVPRKRKTSAFRSAWLMVVNAAPGRLRPSVARSPSYGRNPCSISSARPSHAAPVPNMIATSALGRPSGIRTPLTVIASSMSTGGMPNDGAANAADAAPIATMVMPMPASGASSDARGTQSSMVRTRGTAHKLTTPVSRHAATPASNAISASCVTSYTGPITYTATAKSSSVLTPCDSAVFSVRRCRQAT